MRHKHDENREFEARRSDDRRERFEVPEMRDRDDRDDLSEGRDFYGYNFGDYRDFEGSEPDADDYGGRGPDWDDEEAWWRSGERGGRGYAGSDIRGYEGREYPNYGGGYEGYYGGEEGFGPAEYESWRWSSRQSWEPVGEWSSQHSHDFEHPGFGGRRSPGEARRESLGPYAVPRGQRRRRRVQGPGVGELRGSVRPEDRGGAGFRGVPPKGYSRPDSSIHEDVCALLEDADVDPSNVTVSVDEREVMLSGTVDDRWAKRYIEDLAYSVRGVSDVINKLRVEPREAKSGGTLSAPESRSREDVPDAA